ncbi:MAG TPA: hypothetical protein VKA91_01675 [Nitrososphaeraceae archaeon]|nr:hypothetical protein [Nitrososphaeraceae archaeon]
MDGNGNNRDNVPTKNTPENNSVKLKTIDKFGHKINLKYANKKFYINIPHKCTHYF